MRIERAKWVNALKIAKWLLKQPQFSTDNNACYIRGVDNRCYLGVSVQDLHFEMYMNPTEDTFHIAVPAEVFVQLLMQMDAELTLTILENHIKLEDQVQQVRLVQVFPTSVPNKRETQMSTWERLSVLQHLQEVATEQEDEHDLSLTFTQQHVSIGNYMYIKRVAYPAPFPLTLPYSITRLLIACGKVAAQDTFDVGIYMNQELILHIGDIYISTTLYSTITRSAEDTFNNFNPRHALVLDMPLLQTVLARIQKMTKEYSLEFAFSEQGICTCRVADDAQTSEFSLPYTMLDSSLPCIEQELQINREGLYHLLRKTLSNQGFTVYLDVDLEVLLFKNTEEEMLISAIF